MPSAGNGIAVVANHYQNENCHPDGKVKVGIGADSTTREERLGNARRLFAGARAAGVPIVHVRLAVDPGYRGVVVNTPLIREWIALQAWREGTWGVDFVDGLGPVGAEFVITHARNSGFHNSTLADVLAGLNVRHLVCCGVSTAYTVESTVRQAVDIGFEVTVAADACSTGTERQHLAALEAMRPLAEITTVDEILAAHFVFE
jgi:nicotinamidase-related amidase